MASMKRRRRAGRVIAASAATGVNHPTAGVSSEGTGSPAARPMNATQRRTAAVLK